MKPKKELWRLVGRYVCEMLVRICQSLLVLVRLEALSLDRVLWNEVID